MGTRAGDATHRPFIFLLATEGILTVPNAAIKFERGKQVVFKVTGPNKVEKKDVKIGIRGEERTEVLSGIAEGDQVPTKHVLPTETKPEAQQNRK